MALMDLHDMLKRLGSVGALLTKCHSIKRSWADASGNEEEQAALSIVHLQHMSFCIDKLANILADVAMYNDISPFPPIVEPDLSGYEEVGSAAARAGGGPVD